MLHALAGRAVDAEHGEGFERDVVVVVIVVVGGTGSLVVGMVRVVGKGVALMMRTDRGVVGFGMGVRGVVRGRAGMAFRVNMTRCLK